MKRIFVLLAAIVLVLPLWARREPNVPQAYAYGVSLDVQGGYVLMPYAFYGEKRTALGIGTGGEFQLRTTYFIGKHWGMFASFSYLSADMDDVAYFWTVNRAVMAGCPIPAITREVTACLWIMIFLRPYSLLEQPTDMISEAGACVQEWV